MLYLHFLKTYQTNSHTNIPLVLHHRGHTLIITLILTFYSDPQLTNKDESYKLFSDNAEIKTLMNILSEFYRSAGPCLSKIYEHVSVSPMLSRIKK